MTQVTQRSGHCLGGDGSSRGAEGDKAGITATRLGATVFAKRTHREERQCGFAAIVAFVARGGSVPNRRPHSSHDSPKFGFFCCPYVAMSLFPGAGDIGTWDKPVMTFVPADLPRNISAIGKSRESHTRNLMALTQKWRLLPGPSSAANRSWLAQRQAA
jgi:hypothetical protein